MTSYLNWAASTLAMATALVIDVPPAHGQAKPAGRSQPASPSILQAGPSGDSRGWARFIWVGGHLQIDAPRHKKGTQTFRDQNCRESFTVTARDGIPSAHYVYQSPQWQWTLSFEKAKTLRIESWDRSNDRRIIVFQCPENGIVVEDKFNDETRRLAAPTWIHLFHQDRDLVKRHFAPLIDALVPAQTIENLSIATERALPHVVQDLSATPSEIKQWVNELKNPKRRCRRSAERSLLACGSPILGTIKTIDRERLDAHQQAVVDLIIRRLTPPATDQATTLACRFVNDKTYWSAVLEDPDRTIAMTSDLVSHLQSLGIEHSTSRLHLVSQDEGLKR